MARWDAILGQVWRPGAGEGAVRIIGHRGARGLYPENTLAGIEGARALGADAVEIDVRLTADGVVVLHHDPSLNPDTTRGPDGAWLRRPGPAIADLTWADLAGFDVGRAAPGSRIARRFRDQKAIDGARIPRLEQVLALVPQPHLLIEVKPTETPAAIADAVGSLLRQAQIGQAQAATVESFDWRVLRHLRRAWPALPLAWLTEAADAAGAPERVAGEGGRVWCPSGRTLTRGLVRRARAAGLCIVPWTVNAETAIRRCADWGVDALITDYPDRAAAILRR